MGWSGGTFTRTDGTRTGATTWQQAAAEAVDIVAPDHDTHDEDLAQGINNCLTKDGQNSPSADLPMNAKKHTGVANAAARNQYAAAGQVQDNAFCRATDTGAADAYALTLSPAITAYAAGQRFSFVAGNTNTGASTLAVSGLAAKAIQKLGAALVAGDITAADVVVVEYDGTQFQMVSPARTPVLTAGGVATAALADDAVTADKLADTAVTPGSYTLSSITVDQQGRVTAAASGASPVFNESFESSAQTITAAGSLTLAHSLSAQPTLYLAFLVCTDAGGEHGYAQNDEVCVATQMISRGGLASRGCNLVPDATNINVYFGDAASPNTFDIISKSDGTLQLADNAKWKLIVRAWA